MENQSQNPENATFSQPELTSEQTAKSEPNTDRAINERNEQAMQEQADLARFTEENRQKAEAARQAIADSDPNVIREVPTSEARNEQAQPSQPIIEGIPDHLKPKE